MLNREAKVDNNAAWQKKGDFNRRFFYSGMELIREVAYKNSQDTSKIEKIELLGYRDNTTSIHLKINKTYFAEITQALVDHGFPAADFSDKDRGNYHFKLTHVKYLSKFLKTLEAYEPSVAAISKEMMDTFSPYAKNEPMIPGWHKSGSFTKTFNSGDAPLNRREAYLSVLPGSKVTKLELLGYRDGRFVIALDLKKSEYDAVINPLIAKDFTKPDSLNKYMGHDYITIPNEAALKQFLSIISVTDPLIRDISLFVEQSYKAANMPQNDFVPIEEVRVETEENEFKNDRSNDDALLSAIKIIMLDFKLKLLMSELEEQLKSQVSNNSSTLFSQPSVNHKRKESEKSVSDEKTAKIMSHH